LFQIENVLTVAMCDLMGIISIDDISAVTRCPVEAVLASEESVNAAIDQWYGVGGSRKKLIEYEIEGIVQSNVDLTAGVTFANALRAILRQDPDIIYVGEIRDEETAEVAVRSALTGHLVLSTLHTNDAVGAILRLSEMGIKTPVIVSVLQCAFAQRLVRKICPRCK
jgi:hypothetical protein